jgi:hypothetical protein
MAEIFSMGMNCVWYRAAKFTTGIDVTVSFRKPDNTLIEPVSIPESEDGGVYRLCYNFNELGQWLGVFFENGVKTASSVFHIVPKASSAVPYNGETMKCETCSHFTMVHGKDYGICELVENGNPYRRPDDTCPSYSDRST